MKFDHYRHRVERCEQRVDVRAARAQTQWQSLKTTWRESWTPGRILAAGLLGGFLVARARPLRTLGAVSTTRWVQLASSLSGLFASLKAAQAAETAETAADEAEGAAESAEAVVEDAANEGTTGAAQGGIDADGDAQPASVSDGRRRPDTQWDVAPRPAEAATEISER